ncbi:AMP-binding protein [uncultured Roseobacter sp.]|uniref:AMP-binding protein n=1 Tax=uncultured Roseobacter sp. TaxID=114847 RepID=UPI0026396FF9|nr:AMP-binding protein [uncultured Roseobacter sp.]
MTTLVAAFARSAAKHSARTALIDGTGAAHTFSHLQALAETYAAGWYARGVRPGDRVLVAMGIGPDLYASLAALWSLGATAVLPEPAMGLAGVRTAVDATHPKFFCAAGPYRWIRLLLPRLWRARLLTPGKGCDAAPPSHGADPDSVALISFTSGTTGIPKAIPRTHAFLMAQWKAVAPLLHSDGEEIDLVTFPVFVLINLAEGRTSVLPNWKMSRLAGLDPASLVGWISANKCTRALLPPALCDKLIEAQDTGQLRQIFTGGGPVFPDVIRRLQDISDGLKITTVYGSTEAEPIAHAQTVEEGYGLFAGHPVDAVRLRIVDSEIQIAGDHVNRGYLDPARDQETKVVEGDTIWHRTGDAGQLDEQGRLWLLGRVGDEVTIDTGVLHPFAIETAARMWPGVDQVALMALNKTAVLVVAGKAEHGEAWRSRAATFGIADVRHVPSIPLDRRHNSKVDRTALRKLLI